MSDTDDTIVDDAVDLALGAWTPMEPPADFADRVLAAREAAPTRKRMRWLAVPLAGALVAAIAMLVIVPQANRDAAMSVAAERGAEAPTAASAGSGAGSAAVAMNQPVAADAGVAPFTDALESAPVVLPAGESAEIHAADGVASVSILADPACKTILAQVTLADGDKRATFHDLRGPAEYFVTCPDTAANRKGTLNVVEDDASTPLTKRLPDGSAPQLHISKLGGSTSADAFIRGEVQRGWKLSIDGVTVPVDAKGRFTVRIGGASRVAIRAQHPRLGVRFYVTSLITR